MLSDLLRRSRKIVAAVNLHASLMTRLDPLGPAKEVAQRVGVLARSASCGGAQVGRSVGIGARPSYSVRFVVRQGVPSHATYLFKHPLVQDAAGYGLAVATDTRCFHVLVCPDKITCYGV